MRSALPFATLVLLTLAASTALADNQPISGDGGGFRGTGTLTTISNGSGSYTITDISGTGVTGFIATGQFSDPKQTAGPSNDNLLFPSAGALVDSHGFAFTAHQSDSYFDVDIFSATDSNNNTVYRADVLDSEGISQILPLCFSLGDACPSNDPSPMSAARFSGLANAPKGTAETFSFNFAAAATTPEPASFVLLGSGLAGIAGALRRRRA